MAYSNHKARSHNRAPRSPFDGEDRDRRRPPASGNTRRNYRDESPEPYRHARDSRNRSPSPYRRRRDRSPSPYRHARDRGRSRSPSPYRHGRGDRDRDRDRRVAHSNNGYSQAFVLEGERHGGDGHGSKRKSDLSQRGDRAEERQYGSLLRKSQRRRFIWWTTRILTVTRPRCSFSVTDGCGREHARDRRQDE
jgi:hypothetical protein